MFSRTARLPAIKQAAFRLLALSLAVSPFIAAEILLGILGWGNSRAENPFVGFASVQPLFLRNYQEDRYEIDTARQAFFRPDSFAAKKGDREFRIFCLGGSTVQGRPFAIETSFTTWLELSLHAAEPARQWEVVNCGGISYASYRLLPILDEVLSHEADLVIVYTGHNEFLEDRTYSHIRDLPDWAIGPLASATKLRTFNVLRSGYLRLHGVSARRLNEVRPILPEEVDALLDHQGGLEKYHRDDEWRDGVVRHFRHNLELMVQKCRRAGVPIWLVNPVCNLRACPPFKSEHRADLSLAELSRWEQLRIQASENRDDVPQALALLEQALEIDGQYASLVYDLAKCYDSLGLVEQAREAYIQAKELDICPLRIVEAMNAAVKEVASKHNVTLIDVREHFENESRDGIPGGLLLIDHVHPTVAGHQMIAELMMQAAIESKISRPLINWQVRRDEMYDQHLSTLGNRYYLEGEQRLRNLKAWAQGRVGLRPDEYEQKN